MEAHYDILPKRNGKTDGSFKNINAKKSQIYQYSFALPENIPADSGVYNKCIRNSKAILKQKIGIIAHSGQILWGTIQLKIPIIFECQYSDQNKAEAIIKLTKQLNIRDLDNNEHRQSYLQILNSSLKNMLKENKFTDLGKPGQYFEDYFDGNNELDSMGLKVLKGFRFTLCKLNSGLYLQVDVCSRILQKRNLLEVFNGKSLDENKSKYQGTTVVTNYGTFRNYKIEKIDQSLSPNSTFHNEKKGVDMTYGQYYKESYNVTISNNKQPLLLAIKSIKKVLEKGGKKMIEVPEYVYLIPELVSSTGMTDDQRADHSTMKALAPFTKLEPTDRMKKVREIIDKLNSSKNLIEIKNQKRLEGYCLPKPELYYAQGSKVLPDGKGNIKHRGVLKDPFNFNDWIFVHSSGKMPKRDREEADNAVSLLAKSGETYGIQFEEPGFIEIHSNNINAWKEEIRKDTEKNGIPQIIVVYLNPFEEKYYSELKRYLTNDLKCSSQFIRKKTLTNPKGAMSAASKIAIQMNIKVGSIPWEVQKKHPYFKNKNMMYGALSISKNSKGGYTLAFVGTTNSECSKVFGDCKKVASKQNIPSETLQKMFVNWARLYYKANNKVPELIMLFREGLSVPQIQDQLPRTQIPALHHMIKVMAEKTKTPKYNPEIVIVTVNKKISTRYFEVDKSITSNNTNNKFVPQLHNPSPGSIMVESFSTEDRNQFLLAAQYVTQGTCTPTLFRVAYDTSKMPQEALINFTFQQCFNYYNWEGAVRVPACLQYADKLSKLVSQYIKDDIVQSSITEKHFFL